MNKLKVFIGAGGWAYYPTDQEDKLRSYARRFNFVEVNSTFYQIPRLSTVRSWRRRVPRDFTFAVKCHHSATHVNELKPIEDTFSTFRRMNEICHLLKSDILVVQTPSRINYNDKKISDIKNTFNSLSLKPKLAWETRTQGDNPIPRKISDLMAELDITPIVDLSKETPPQKTTTLYSRLFSRVDQGKLEYDEEDVENITRRIRESGANTVYLAFHGIRMYNDASNFQEFYEDKDPWSSKVPR